MYPLCPFPAPIICLATANRQMGTEMHRTQPPTLTLVGRVSIARLHGRACFDCGAVQRKLTPVARVRLPDSARVWTIVACGCRTEVPR